MPRRPPADLARHRHNQLWHFKKRVRQRFRRELSDDDCADLLHRIKEDKPGVVFLQTNADRRSVWRVKWRGLVMVVVYDHRTECLVTAYKYKAWRWR